MHKSLNLLVACLATSALAAPYLIPNANQHIQSTHQSSSSSIGTFKALASARPSVLTNVDTLQEMNRALTKFDLSVSLPGLGDIPAPVSILVPEVASQIEDTLSALLLGPAPSTAATSTSTPVTSQTWSSKHGKQTSKITVEWSSTPAATSVLSSISIVSTSSSTTSPPAQTTAPVSTSAYSSSWAEQSDSATPESSTSSTAETSSAAAESTDSASSTSAESTDSASATSAASTDSASATSAASTDSASATSAESTDSASATSTVPESTSSAPATSTVPDSTSSAPETSTTAVDSSAPAETSTPAPDSTTTSTPALSSTLTTSASPAFSYAPTTSDVASSTTSDIATSTTSEGAAGTVTATPEENDSEYLAPVSIGGQTLTLDFDTGSADLWVFSSDLSAAEIDGHVAFNPSESSTWTVADGSTWEISYGDGSSASGSVGYDTVIIGGATATQQAIEIATSVSSSFVVDTQNDGLVGLAWSSINTIKPTAQKTFFENIMDSLDLPLFTADLRTDGSSTYEFGTIDSSKYTGDIYYTAIDNSNGFWQFPSTSYSIGSETYSNANAAPAIADTGTSIVLADATAVAAYYAQIDGAYVNSTAGGYVFPCTATIPDFGVAIGDSGFTAVIPGTANIYATLTDGSCFGGIQSNTGINYQVFGDVLLRQFFAIFNGGDETFGIATKD